MTRKQYTAAMLATIAITVGALVVYNITKPQEYKYYYPFFPTQRETLKSMFGKHGINFGFSVSSRSFENPVTRRLIVDHANIVTTEVAMKMEYIQPQQGVFDFSEADAIVAYADELGIGVHGHTASWWGQNPAWLTEGVFTYLELEYILSNHVSTLSSHYGGRLTSLDTANEAYAGSGGNLLCGPWCLLGDDYVKLSFDIDADYPIIYNSNFWNTQDPTHAIRLLDEGVAEGIGIQLHLSSDGWQRRLDRMDDFLDRIRQHGGFARFSEVGVLSSSDQEQAEIYAAITRLAIKHSDIVRDVIIWGVTPPMWRGDVGIFDREGNPKPSFYAIMDELK